MLRDMKLSLNEWYLMFRRIIGNHSPKEAASHSRRPESSKCKSVIKNTQQTMSEMNGTE
jgi:hypothetical protein